LSFHTNFCQNVSSRR